MSKVDLFVDTDAPWRFSLFAGFVGFWIYSGSFFAALLLSPFIAFPVYVSLCAVYIFVQCIIISVRAGARLFYRIAGAAPQ